MCPPVLIRMYISCKSFPDQSYLQRSHFNVKSLWAQLKITTYQPYFSQFVEAVSTYTGILCHIKFTIKEPLPKALQVYDFSFKSMHTISQTLKYHIITKDTYSRPHYLPMGLQALTTHEVIDNHTLSSNMSRQSDSSSLEESSDSVTEKPQQHTASFELDYDSVWKDPILTTAEDLADTLQGAENILFDTVHNDILNSLPDAMLEMSTQEYLPNLQNHQTIQDLARSDLESVLDSTFELDRMNLSAEDHILTNGHKLIQISNDHHENNPDMYNQNDITVRDRLTDSLINIHQAWSDLNSYGTYEEATRQLCQAAANHFRLLHHVHSLPYITQDYAYGKLLLIQ